MRTIRNIEFIVTVIIGLIAFTTSSCSITHAALPAQIPIDKFRDESGIKIRIYAPHPAVCDAEPYHLFIARVENRSDRVIPILTCYPPSLKDRPVVQFASQTWADALRGICPNTNSWAEIRKQADCSLASGQAIELRSGFAIGVQLPRQGRSRLVLQTSENSFVYSNWVELTEETGSTDKFIADVYDTWDTNFWTTQFISIDSPSGKWLCTRLQYLHEPYPRGKKLEVNRVCLMPDGEIPTITPDIARRQDAIEFPKHPRANTYYNPLIAWFRSTPWPIGQIAITVHGTPIPADSVSPLEFPLELFNQ